MIPFRNKTRFRNEWLAEALAKVTPHELVGDFIAIFYEARANQGWALPQGDLDVGEAYFYLEINPETQFPHVGPGHNEYAAIKVWNFEELILHLIAHEVRHLYQAYHSHLFPNGRHAPGIERDAEESALRVLRAYRVGELKIAGLATARPMPRTPGKPVFV